MGTPTQMSAEQARQTDSTSNPSLQTSLHTATRSKHANLNRTITSRLPLCLPPYTATPLPYHLGMLAFGSIYEQLERAVENIRKEQPKGSPSQQDRLRHVQITERLFTEGLDRTQRLKHDAQILRQRLQCTRQFSANSTSTLEEMEESVARKSEASTSQLYERIKDKPYLALAYSWAMYLALFNGGRWLLKQLEGPGSDFWLTKSEQDSTQQSIRPLSFWHFDAATAEDPHAEQLKLTFKQNFDLASSMLTEEETAEVVEEGKAVFDMCSGLIETLDVCIQEIGRRSTISQPQSDSSASHSQESLSPVWQTLESVVLAPVYQIVRRIWTESPRSDVRIAAG